MTMFHFNANEVQLFDLMLLVIWIVLV